MAKAGANYMNSQLIKMEAVLNGYVEGIALDVNGYVSEGSGENIFLVRNGKLFTPPLGNSVLAGITRDSVLRVAQDLSIPVVEQIIPRELLYLADEVFFTGTAAEVTPIRSVDKITVGDGAVGPVTKAIRKELFSIFDGSKPDRYNWLTPVPVRQKARLAAPRYAGYSPALISLATLLRRYALRQTGVPRVPHSPQLQMYGMSEHQAAIRAFVVCSKTSISRQLRLEMAIANRSIRFAVPCVPLRPFASASIQRAHTDRSLRPPRQRGSFGLIPVSKRSSR